jgi:drug/metabolite transporter (DMT)-like permease
MKHWLMFLGLGGIWGSSFLLIKVGVEDLGPLPLVSVRIGLAALLMAVFLRLTGRAWPTGRTEVAALVFVGVMNTAVPFSLITWGEQKIDSGLATVLDATVPLFTLVIAHFALTDERISPQKIVGLVTGFLGVVLLASRHAASSSPNPFSGQFAVLVASACYALSVVVIRRYLRRVDSFVVAGGSLMVGGIVVVLVTLLTASLPVMSDVHIKAVLAVLVLAVMNTVVAYFLFYSLISAWGATRTTLVTYIMPPIGVTLGAIFLDETVDWKIVAAAGLILGGILVVNWRGRRRPAPAVMESVDSALVEPD